MRSTIAKKLLRWYASRRPAFGHRSLPWRENPRPYAVWVAEIMAQQTRLETMLPYYQRWMKRFPTIRSLAKSKEQAILTVWEGLGYYSRARNLRRAAQLVLERYNGKLPNDTDSLLALPGIGRYTAGAIASMAYGRNEPAVDGNAVRVLARVFNVKLQVDSSRATKRFWMLAAEHLPPGHAAEYNQALMDLGASICKPRQPACMACPLRRDCRAFALGIQEKRPVRKAIKGIPRRHYAAAVIKQRGQVLVVQRPAKGLLGGMWEFPNVIIASPRNAKSALRRGIFKKLGFFFPFTQKLGQYEHSYSHFDSHLQVFGASLNGSRPKIVMPVIHRWLLINKLDKLPMGKLDRQIARSLRDNAKTRRKMSRGFQRRVEDFVCGHCGVAVQGTGYTNHCPRCLWSRHVDVMPGDRQAECGGLMAPVAVSGTADTYRILHRCQICRTEIWNQSSPHDDFLQLLVIAELQGKQGSG